MKTPHEQIKEALEQSILDLSYYVHLATKAKTNNKWIDCEVYKIEISLERLNKALALLETHAVVPREPTNQMNNAAIDATGAGSDMSWRNKTPQMVVAVAYRAMIAAAERGE